MTLSIKGLFVTLSISNNQQYIYAECRYAECHDLFIVMLNVIMMSVVMLSVVVPNVVTLYQTNVKVIYRSEHSSLLQYGRERFL
jgi:hypothetical protein